MQLESSRQGLAPASEEGASPALAISSVFKYEANMTCAVFVEVTELAWDDGIAAGVTPGPQTILVSKGGESDWQWSHAVASPKQRSAGFRVPAVYLTSAFLSFLLVSSERGMNNLRVCSGLNGSSPTAGTIVSLA
jgi:hypothetical protein